MTPTQRTKARAFAIWRYANPRDWNVTYEEIAEATGMTVSQVEWAIIRAGWVGRLQLPETTRAKRAESVYDSNFRRPDLTQIFRTTRLTDAQAFGMDWS